MDIEKCKIIIKKGHRDGEELAMIVEKLGLEKLPPLFAVKLLKDGLSVSEEDISKVFIEDSFYKRFTYENSNPFNDMFIKVIKDEEGTASN